MIERREKIGTGWEHEVFESKIEGWVLKRPKGVALALFRLFFKSPSDVLKQELDYHSERLKRNYIKFPETRIFTIGKGYIVAQRIIEEDLSLNPLDIRGKLEQTGDQYLIDLYQRDSSNFRSNNGDLFCLDLTFGFNRYPHKLGIINIENQKHLTAILSRTLSRPVHEGTILEAQNSAVV